MATGVGLVEGLQDIESQTDEADDEARHRGGAPRHRVGRRAVHGAVAKHPKVFGELYVNIVRAGEATGKIDRALDDLVAQLEWQAELNSRIREVATYPLLVVFMLGVAVGRAGRLHDSAIPAGLRAAQRADRAAAADADRDGRRPADADVLAGHHQRA